MSNYDRLHEEGMEVMLETIAQVIGERDFLEHYDLVNTTVGVVKSGTTWTITETGNGVTAVTVITKQSSTVRRIVTTVTPTGDYKYIKTTAITKTATGYSISNTYTKEAKVS